MVIREVPSSSEPSPMKSLPTNSAQFFGFAVSSQQAADAPSPGEGNMKIAILGLNLSLVALAFSKALEVLNGNLVVNSNNEGGVAGINFFFCKDNRHWTSFAQSIYKLIHNKYSFLSVLTVDLSILFFNRIFKNIDNISRKSSSDRFSQSK